MPKLKTMEVTLPARTFEQITVADTAVGVNSTDAGEGVLVSVETASIRYRIDGGEANGTHGHLLYAGTSLFLHNANAVENLSMIRDGATNATIQVTHF